MGNIFGSVIKGWGIWRVREWIEIEKMEKDIKTIELGVVDS